MAAKKVRWWDDQAVVQRSIAGTFEGGGAKGVAYLGALQATLAKGCWFGAVAGASAGAITATLIAAGLTIDELETESDVAFTKMRPGSVVDAVFRLRRNFGALPNRDVHDWLEERLRAQADAFGIDVPGPVTFAMLYEATGIELNVVAADVSRGRQLVFSVWDTPDAQVADAVIASSAIPFVFAPKHLEVEDAQGGTVTHTIVDGGVWSNFPEFVFKDRSYRQFSGRPAEPTQDVVVGYLLAESEEQETDFHRSRFRAAHEAAPPREWRAQLPAAKASKARGPVKRIVISIITIVVVALMALLWPLLALGSWLSLGHDPLWKGRWPPMRGVVRFVFGRVDDALSSLHNILFAAGAGFLVVFGAFLTIAYLWSQHARFLIDDIRIDMGFDDPYAVSLALVKVAILGMTMVLVVAITLLTIALIIGNVILLGPIRQAAYGVLKTYVAGPGAPIWTGRIDEDDVIRLPIPPGLTTLSFDRTQPGVEEAVAKAIGDAAAVTTTRLTAILARIEGKPRAAVAAPPPYAMREAPEVPAYPGNPASFLVRAAAATGFVAIIVLAAIYLAPTPNWRGYQVNVRFCEQAMTSPDDACDEPTGNSVFANVLFGPPSGGHKTLATITAAGGEVTRSEEVTSPDGRPRIVSIDLAQNCGDTGCELSANGLVDGELTFRRTLRMEVSAEQY